MTEANTKGSSESCEAWLEIDKPRTVHLYVCGLPAGHEPDWHADATNPDFIWRASRTSEKGSS